jgi:hypothetical protein
MADQFLIRTSGGPWREPASTGYENESALQEILYSHPALVPGVFGEPVACREFQSDIGPADVVIIDAEGSITLVECKLASNSQIRREIVGQTLDYASRLWQMSIESFEERWRKAEKSGQSPLATLDDSEGRIRDAVSENLRLGRFNLVLAVDRINDDLKRIVEYLNTVTVATVGVMVVEFARVVDGDTEILIPRTYGTELVETKAKSSGAKHQWSLQEYLDWCDAHDPVGAPTMRTLLDALRDNGYVISGGRAATPSLNIGLEVPGLGRKWPICLYTDPVRGGLVEVRFSDFKDKPEYVDQFAQLVSAVPGIPVPVEEVRAANYGKRPNVPVREFTHHSVQQLAAAIASIGHHPG